MTTENKQPEQSPAESQASAYISPSQRDISELTAALEKEGLVTPKQAAPASQETRQPAAPQSQETQKTDTQAAEVKPQTPEEPRLLKLARDRDAQRKAVEQKELDSAKPYLDALKVLSPIEAGALARAKQMGDPVAALNALGFTHSQYTAKMLGQEVPTTVKPAETPQPKPPPEENSKLVELERQVAELRREREQNQGVQLHNNIRELVKKSDKTPSLATMEELGYNVAAEIENVVKDFYSRTGTLPGSTFEETVEIAAESLEHHYKQQLELLEKVGARRKGLTSSAKPAQVEHEVSESPRVGTEKPKTLTNASVSHPGTPRSVPKTINERLQAFAERGEAAFEDS